MRYYELTITDSGGSIISLPSGGKAYWTSHSKGINQPPDPGALNIEFQVVSYPMGAVDASGASWLTIQGISLQDISQAQQFYGKSLTLKAGMAKGLPLADPSQSGLIFSGFIYQSFGNWQGTEMSLSFVIAGQAQATETAPGNFSFNWSKGSLLKTNLQQLFGTIYPNAKQNFSIMDVVLSSDQPGTYTSLRTFSQFLTQFTQGYGGNSDYPGVQIAMVGGDLYIFDGTQTPSATKTLRYQDIVGQPTWYGPNQIAFSTVLRADLQMANTIKMPSGSYNSPGFVATLGSSSPSQINYPIAFQGGFTIKQVQHVGNFRSPDGREWVTNFIAVPSKVD